MKTRNILDSGEWQHAGSTSQEDAWIAQLSGEMDLRVLDGRHPVRLSGVYGHFPEKSMFRCSGQVSHVTAVDSFLFALKETSKLQCLDPFFQIELSTARHALLELVPPRSYADITGRSTRF